MARLPIVPMKLLLVISVLTVFPLGAPIVLRGSAVVTSDERIGAIVSPGAAKPEVIVRDNDIFSMVAPR